MFFPEFESLEKSIKSSKFSAAAKLIEKHLKTVSKGNYRVWLEELISLCNSKGSRDKIIWNLNLVKQTVEEKRSQQKEIYSLFGKD